jgi:hypothetical protein
MFGNLNDLTSVLLLAATGGAILAFGYLAGQRVTKTRNVKMWAGAALISIPGLLLGWMVTQPQLNVRATYGNLSEAILGEEEPVAETSTSKSPRPVSPPRASDRSGLRGGSSQPSAGTRVEPSDEPQPAQPVPPVNPPPPTSEPTPSETPSPTPSPTQSPSPTPSPTQSPSPTPSPTVEPAVEPQPQPLPPPPPPEPSG